VYKNPIDRKELDAMTYNEIREALDSLAGRLEELGRHL
jgi:hypothetical protein